MSEKKKKPKWLKNLQTLMKSTDEKDREQLRETLEKLKEKANDLKRHIDQEVDETEKLRLIEKLELVNKHRKKGLHKLVEPDDQE